MRVLATRTIDPTTARLGEGPRTPYARNARRRWRLADYRGKASSNFVEDWERILANPETNGKIAEEVDGYSGLGIVSNARVQF